ncbi:MAG: NADH-quinone oxidoreductase subunit N [Ignavibacteria bacterium]|nr:NADH-quinone oxidoreductase subunit N [Ignavibacteria bacterium]
MIKTIDFLNSIPLLIISVSAVITILVGSFYKKSTKYVYAVTLIALIAAIYYSFGYLDKEYLIYNNFLRVNNITTLFSIIALFAVLLSTLSAKAYIEKEEINFIEFYSLVLFSTAGMLIMIQSYNLITVFVGLELMSISFYILTGFLRKRIKSNESALKYFLLGAFMTGFLLFGISLIYGITGSMSYANIFQDTSVFKNPVFLIGSALFMIGFFFKMGLFPFHLWVPDVYEGAPTTITGLMSTAGKIAAVGTITPFIVYTASDNFRLIFSIIALLTMLIGNVTALAQSNIKRILAFSSIASAGYILVGVAAMNDLSIKSVSFYLLAYTLMQLGAFIIVSLIEKPAEGINEYRNVDIEDYKGLARTNPQLAIPLTIFLFSLGGIPPLAGFWGKYYLFYAAIQSNLIWLSISAILFSVISLYYYLKIVVYMWFNPPANGDVYKIDSMPSLSILIAAFLTFLFGIFPQYFFALFKTPFK